MSPVVVATGALPGAVAPEVAHAPLGLAAAVCGLDAALEAFDRVDLGSVTGGELAEAAVALHAVANRLAAVDGQVVGRFSGSGHWALDGARTVRGWLRVRTSAGEGTITGRTAVARAMERHPLLAARLVSGEVSSEHLLALASVHGRWPTLRPVLDAAEQVIADYAVGRPPAELRRFLHELVLRAAPDAVDAAEGRRLTEQAHCHVTSLPDGWVRVAALLPPDLGARFVAALAAAARLPVDDSPADATPDDGPVADASASAGSETDSSAADGAAAGGADASGSDDATPEERRPAGQRGLDRLGRLLDVAEAGFGDRRLPNVRGSRPVVQVTVDLQTISALRGATGLEPAALTSPGGVAPFPVGAEAARRLGCDAAIRRLVVDPAGLVLDVGRTSRVIGGALRAAVHHRDRNRCRWPGCRDPIDEVHHVVHWAHGGATDRSNLLGVCWWHHHVVHERGWRMSGDADVEVTLHNPAGRAPFTSPVPGRRAATGPPPF